ncbi:hypothetical protein POPTR_015G117600v4 [Populus trichocarpa]|uniref:Uncharacterized protein n=1 Tax=Populus trichocarpa TaxID=3694 RepID=A0ACC0RW57_POPTR|nr:hypothetical protein POPTR_015G117600v4 [Populus trichocarpa]
MKANIGVLIN